MLSRCLRFELVLLPLAATLAWHLGRLWLLPLSLLLPWSLGRAASRSESFLRACLYFAAVWWPCVPGASLFFEQATPLGGIVIWLMGTLLSSTPFLLWQSHRRYQALGVLSGLGLHALLPIGLGSPLLAAGALYPGLRWLGLGIGLWLCFLLALPGSRRLYALALCGGVAALCQVEAKSHPAPDSWRAIHTNWGGSGLRSPSPLADWEHLQAMLDQAEHTSGQVFLYPETILTNWSAPTASFIAAEQRQLAAEGKTILFGAETSGRLRDNRLWAVGASQTCYRQRIPIPLAMWGRDVRAHVLTPGFLVIHGQRAAVLLCYEQLLIAPALASFLAGPDLLLAPSNLYWAQGTTIPVSEHLCAQAWARLFGVPLLEAVNR